MDFLHQKSARKYEFCVYFCRDMDREYIDLLELQSQLREEIESSFPERVWVRAEIASVQAKANGHCYLDLAQSEEGHFDAILMDMRMPVMDGLTATREIRKLTHPDAASIPIIALSANAFEEDVQQCLQAGMNEHLSKPVDVDRLKETLGRLLGLE